MLNFEGNVRLFILIEKEGDILKFMVSNEIFAIPPVYMGTNSQKISDLSILALRSTAGGVLLPFCNVLSCFQRGGGVAVRQEPPGEAHAATQGRGSL